VATVSASEATLGMSGSGPRSGPPEPREILTQPASPRSAPGPVRTRSTSSRMAAANQTSSRMARVAISDRELFDYGDFGSPP